MVNIVLIGLSGSGKSTLGAMLAEKLGLDFVDLDDDISAAAELSIPDIFSLMGEEIFRNMETEAAQAASEKRGQVIATGGGIVLTPVNIQFLRRGGYLVFLDRSPDDIIADADLSGRPLLQGGAEKLFKLAEERREAYLMSADYVLENNKGAEHALEALCALCTPLAAKGRYAVIGQPIAHSLSPVIHGAIFKARGEKESYTRLLAPAQHLGSFFAGLLASKLQGINVTIPHKESIIPYLCETAESAKLCGAVNTAVRGQHGFTGHNTDIGGLALAVKKAGHSFAGKNVLITGAGGAARAAAAAAVQEKALKVHIAARNKQKREQIAEGFSEKAAGTVFTTGGMAAAELAEAAKTADILINCTPLGMQGVNENFEEFSFLESLPKTALVYDLIYNPAETLLLQKSKQLGLATANGLDMLIYQAILAQEIFAEKELDKEKLYIAARAALEEGILK